MDKEYSLEEIKNIVINVWNEIKRILSDVADVFREVEKENKFRQTWYVPKKIIKHHQVINRKPLNAKARAQI